MHFSERKSCVHRRLKLLLAILMCVGLAAILFRKPVQEAVLLRSLLMSDSAPETAFLALADGTRDRFAFLQRNWNTKKIPHRALVATYLKDNAGASPDLYRRAESLLVSATMDVDASVRELAMATLAQQKHPALPRLAAALLRDADPQMRLLGVQYLRKHDATLAVPLVFNLLDDADPSVVTTADAALRNWTKQDFNIRLVHASLNSAGGTNSSPEPANLKIIQEGVQRWKEWWNSHQQDYPVLLDPSNEVGRRFNGGELPTNVLIDPQGNVRRRFIGGRNVAAFEAMIDEPASQKPEP